MFTQGLCDVCNQTKEIGVASLPFAPMSVAFCRDCLQNRAYPLWALHIARKLCDGNVADWFNELKSYHDGEYITGQKVKELYDKAG